MGGELIRREPSFLSLPKTHKTCVFAGPDNLDEPEEALKNALFLSEQAGFTGNLCFYVPTAFYQNPAWDENRRPQALAALYEIKSRAGLLTATNLGNWESLADVSKVADVVFVEDYLCLMKKKLQELSLLRKPSVLDLSLLPFDEVQELARESELASWPVLLYFRTLSFEHWRFYQRYLCAGVFDSENLPVFQAALKLGVRGFFIASDPLWVKKVLEICKEQDKILE